MTICGRRLIPGGHEGPQTISVVTALAFVLVSLSSLAACSPQPKGRSAVGDAERGQAIIARQSCGSCHQIPGIPLADGVVGPPLDHFRSRTMIAGLLPNRPSDLVRWLRAPQSVLPHNGMPDTGLTDEEARNVAAYLYTLQ